MDKSVYNTLKTVSVTQSKNEKEAILLQHKESSALKQIFEYAYSPTMQYFMRKIPDFTPTGESFSWTEFFAVLDTLRLRKKTGNEAQAFVVEYLSTLPNFMSDLFIRVLHKDLKVGVGKQTINKVWKNLIVTPPRQGAKGCNEENLSKLAKKRKAIEQKADGSFMAYFDDFMTRSGQPVTLEPLKEHLDCGAFNGYAFEGEIIFDETKAAREDNGIVNKFVQDTASFEEKDSAIYLVWDCIRAECYEPKGVDKTPNYKRRETLECMMQQYHEWCDENSIVPKIKLIPRKELVTMEEAKAIFEDYVIRGFEGCILKDMDAPWKAVDKPSHCVKMKKQDPADLLVVDLYEGTGKASGKLGGIKLESGDGEIKTDCGSGFSDEQREYFWLNKNEILGKIVEIEYEKVSENSKTKQKSVTFPIFKKLRFDKLDADSYQDILDKQRIK
jgi:hypothetical protein